MLQDYHRYIINLMSVVVSPGCIGRCIPYLWNTRARSEILLRFIGGAMFNFLTMVRKLDQFQNNKWSRDGLIDLQNLMGEFQQYFLMKNVIALKLQLL